MHAQLPRRLRRRPAAGAVLGVLAAAGILSGAARHGRDGVARASAPRGSGAPAVVAQPAAPAQGIAPKCPIRPVTQMAAPFFEDVSVAAGIKPAEAVAGQRAHPRTRWVDLDGDGWDDIVSPTMFPDTWASNASPKPYDWVAYRNNRDGTFTDVSAASGLQGVQAGFMAFGDWDNDGDEDAFAGLDIPNHYDTSVPHTHQILLNDGTGVFTVKPNSGVEVPAGIDPRDGSRVDYAGGNAAVADYDNDGRLDIFLGNGHTSWALPDQLFFGRGDGTFVNKTANLAGNEADESDGSVACDVDADGDLDIFSATYGVSWRYGHQFLWINDGKGGFTNEARRRGIEAQPGGNTFRKDNLFGMLPQPGVPQAEWIGSNGFGVDCGDVNGDGLMDLLVANISHPSEFPFPFRDWTKEDVDFANKTRRWSDPSMLFVNRGPGYGWSFRNEWQRRGLPYNEGDIDTAMADYDNDGRPDIGVSRDRKYDASFTEIDQLGWFGLHHQEADGSFRSVGYTSGINHPEDPAAAARMRGSGSVGWSDYDHDGDLDLLLGGGPGATSGHLFKNTQGNLNDWLSVRVVGDGKAVNADAIGAVVTLRWRDAGGGWRRERLSQVVKASRGTFNSMDSRVLHFGLGERSCDYALVVEYPDGHRSSWSGDVVGRNRRVAVHYDDTLRPDDPTSSAGTAGVRVAPDVTRPAWSPAPAVLPWANRQ